MEDADVLSVLGGDFDGAVDAEDAASSASSASLSIAARNPRAAKHAVVQREQQSDDDDPDMEYPWAPLVLTCKLCGAKSTDLGPFYMACRSKV